MKKLLLPFLLISLLVVAGIAGYLVTKHRGEYLRGLEISTADQRAKADKVQADKLNVVTTERDNIAKDNARLRSECLKGAAAYAKLPLSTRKLIGGINCGE